MHDLQPKTLPALDWHGIWPGYVSYGEDGMYFSQDLPTGLRLTVQQAECSAPVMVREKRWEADCDRLCGDELDGVVHWNGRSDLSALKGKKIHLRFRMARTRLYAITL
jgi:hypothetical protein